MDTFLVKNYLKHNLIALLKRTQQAHPDKINQTDVLAEIELLNRWLTQLVIN
jgi:hypothetical protein